MSVAVLTIAPGVGHLSPAHSLTFDNADDPILNQQHQRDKGTQTVTALTATRVTHLIDLGAMGKPVQTIEAQATDTGARVTWTVTSDMGYNPVFRIFGLFMDRTLGKAYEFGLKNIASLA